MNDIIQIEKEGNSYFIYYTFLPYAKEVKVIDDGDNVILYDVIEGTQWDYMSKEKWKNILKAKLCT